MDFRRYKLHLHPFILGQFTNLCRWTTGISAAQVLIPTNWLNFLGIYIYTLRTFRFKKAWFGLVCCSTVYLCSLLRLIRPVFTIWHGFRTTKQGFEINTYRLNANYPATSGPQCEMKDFTSCINAKIKNKLVVRATELNQLTTLCEIGLTIPDRFTQGMSLHSEHMWKVRCGLLLNNETIEFSLHLSPSWKHKRHTSSNKLYLIWFS